MIKFEQGDILGFIKNFESFTPVAKINPLDGNWELGYGQTGEFLGKKIVSGMTCTEEQAENQVCISIANINSRILSRLKIEDFQGYRIEGEINAMVSLCYNGGLSFCPNLFSLWNMGKLELASHQFLDAFYVDHKPILGLLLRRLSEFRIFTQGVYCRLEKNDPITPEERDILLAMNARNEDAIKMIKELKIE